VSIWASWSPDIGETKSEKPDWSVVSAQHGWSNWYPRCNEAEAKPASIGLAHIPGWIGPNPRYRPQTDDQPVAPFLRLSITADNAMDLAVQAVQHVDVILKPRAVEKLRDQLNEWLAMERHRR
jgi:hypothetical protein